ncbi:hypothetical protein MRX96_040399 [Rhipicephalus microplus]
MSICYQCLVDCRTRVVRDKKLGPVTRSTGQMNAPEHFVWKDLDLMDELVETGTHLCHRCGSSRTKIYNVIKGSTM